MEDFLNRITGALPDILVGILILILAFIVATLVKKFVVGLLNKSGLKEKLSSANTDPRETDKMVNLLGNLAFLIVFLLFLPAIFSKLGLEALAAPFAGFTTFALEFIPKLIAAIVILYIGFFVAKIIKDVVETVLSKIGVNEFVSQGLKMNEEPKVKMSEVLSNVVYAFIALPLIIVALDLLGLTAISEPAKQIISDFLSYVPKLFVAALLIGVGFFIAQFLSNLLQNLLVSVNTDGLLAKVGIKESFKLSELISKIVMVVMMIIFTVEAFNVLDLQVLKDIGAAIIKYLPMVLSGILILIGAYLLGNFVEQKIVERDPKQNVLALIIKIVILVLAVFMTLTQLGFARSIVEYAFILLLGAVAVAFALSFGLGGKDFAKNKLNELDRKLADAERNEVIADVERNENL